MAIASCGASLLHLWQQQRPHRLLLCHTGHDARIFDLSFHPATSDLLVSASGAALALPSTHLHSLPARC